MKITQDMKKRHAFEVTDEEAYCFRCHRDLKPGSKAYSLELSWQTAHLTTLDHPATPSQDESQGWWTFGLCCWERIVSAMTETMGAPWATDCRARRGNCPEGC